MSVEKSWQRQINMLNTFQNIGWAVEFMSKELRRAYSSNVNILGGNRITFRIDPDSNNQPPWMWIEYFYDIATSKIYRRWRYTGSVWSDKKVLASHVVSNPSGNAFFRKDPTDNKVIIIEITTRPDPSKPEGTGNINYTLITSIRPRN